MLKRSLFHSLLFTVLFNSLYAQDSLILNKGIEYLYEYKDSLAEPLLKEALKEGNDLNENQRGSGQLYLMFILWDKEEFSEAITSGNKAVESFKKVGNTFMAAKTLYSLSMYNLTVGDYELALIQVQNAYQDFSSVKDTNMMILTLARKGVIFHDIEEYDDGIKVCNEADNLHRIYSDKNADLQVRIWGIKAINYDDNNQSREAIKLYDKILTVESELSSEGEIIRTYNNLGNSLRKLGELDKAKEYITKNLEANEARNFRYGIATAKTNLGDIALQQGNLDEAKIMLHEAEKIAYEINDIEKILDVLKIQQSYYETTGNLSASLTYSRKYHSLKDSLYGIDKQRQLRLLEKRFETKNKEQKIELQSAQLSEQAAQIKTNKILLIATVLVLLLVISLAVINRSRIRKKQELVIQQQRIKGKEAELKAAISSQEKERSRYARDLHDGLGQMISVLNRNLQNLQEVNDEVKKQESVKQAKIMLNDMYDEIKRICFDMLPHALTSGGLVPALKELAIRINQTKQLKVITDFEGLEKGLSNEHEVVLYRITQEWLNNILKYSDANTVTLQLTSDSKEFTAMIEDDGTGFDTELLTKSQGNGWRNINSRVNILNGTLHLESQKGIRGTSLIIDIALTKSTNKVEQTTY